MLDNKEVKINISILFKKFLSNELKDFILYTQDIIFIAKLYKECKGVYTLHSDKVICDWIFFEEDLIEV